MVGRSVNTVRGQICANKEDKMLLDDKRKFIRTADVSTGDTITIKSEGEWIENRKYTYDDGSPKIDFVIKVEYNGELRDMRLNKTNREILKENWGKETGDWMGKTAKIKKVNAMIGGEMMDVILLEA